MKIEINMNQKTDQNVIYVMQADAYWAYLDFCNTIGEIPRKEIYNQIKSCTDGQALDRITSFIEIQHSNYEKKMKQKAESKKVSFWSRIFKF